MARRYLIPFVQQTFPSFVAYPFHVFLASALQRFEEKVAAGLSPRLIIEAPPRIGKSTITSKYFPAWFLGRHPDWYFGLVSYGDDLAWEFSAEARQIIQEDEYAEIFGATYQIEDTAPEIVAIDDGFKSVKHWKLANHRGGMRSAGINGALTGRGYHCVVFDDPTKSAKEADSLAYRDMQWKQYKDTFYSRVEPGGGIIIISPRWTTDDLVGRLLAEAEDNWDDPYIDKWEVISIPAKALPSGEDVFGRAPGEYLVPGRFTVEQWRRIEANTHPRHWAAQYQQTPVPEEGQIFHPYEDFVFENPPVDADGFEWKGLRYGFADTSHAKKRESDYSVNGIWQVEPNRTLGLLDVFRERVQFPELKRITKAMYDRYGLNGQVIEDYSSGIALSQEFKRDAHMKIITWRPDKDKIARGHAATDVMADWRIRLPRGNNFPSGLPVKVYLQELSAFRGSGDEHDDMVDMTTMALYLLGTRSADMKRLPVTADFAFS